MAKLTRDGSDAVVTLSMFEKIEGLLDSTRFPLADVTTVTVLDNTHDVLEGWGRDYKISGRYNPGTTAVGTFRNGDSGGMTLALVHHDTPRGLQIDLSQGFYSRVIIGLDDPDAARAEVFGTEAE